MGLTPTEKHIALTQSRDLATRAESMLDNMDEDWSDAELQQQALEAGVTALLSISYALQAIASGER